MRVSCVVDATSVNPLAGGSAGSVTPPRSSRLPTNVAIWPRVTGAPGE
jgi:hypothetical protein